MTDSLPLMKSVLPPLAKSVLISLELSAGMSAADAAIQKKKKSHEWGKTELIISNEEMKDSLQIRKSFNHLMNQDYW